MQNYELKNFSTCSCSGKEKFSCMLISLMQVDNQSMFERLDTDRISGE